jgi:hypothetical protein
MFCKKKKKMRPQDFTAVLLETRKTKDMAKTVSVGQDKSKAPKFFC